MTTDDTTHDNEPVWGALCSENWRNETNFESLVNGLAMTGAEGLLIPDVYLDKTNEARDVQLIDLANMLAVRGMRFIVGISVNPSSVDVSLIQRAGRISSEISIGMWHGEFNGQWRDLQTFAVAVEAIGGKPYYCPTVGNLLADMKGQAGHNQRVMIERNITGICLCGYVFGGYLFDDPRVPHQGYEAPGKPHTSLAGQNLGRDHGLTLGMMQEYLSKVDMWSGVGWQPGLDAGTRIYNRIMGFKGVVCGVPFNIDKSLDVKVNPLSDNLDRICGAD